MLMAVPLIPYGNMLFVCMGARMTRQLAVPNCDGPILLLRDVSSCCAGTPSLKMQRSAGVAASRARLLCRCSIDPQQSPSPPSWPWWSYLPPAP